ncbi:TauD/TfdA family dioxygenase [Streptomyces sp. HU2014]|uniref:TauD/TfdA family dioxygenase n=1 Tax=Streptomyces sp. HU2014 TaxID=2939414 RepID=UPI00200D0384|nr:TauD/TfdA family dioxygenase [Streptomyces sp. HU2014]UQI45906.1 TauD/TfdA family dioxygenase [Streptomyces sp. HU2014]
MPTSRTCAPDGPLLQLFRRPSPGGGRTAIDVVDAEQSQAARRSAAGLRRTGLVALSGLAGRETVAQFAGRIMAIQRQRYDGPDGLTSMGAPTRPGLRNAERPVDLGVALHTEGSTLVRSPRLLLLTCLRAPAQGGHVRLVDGQRLHRGMVKRCPAAVAVFASDSAGFFGSSCGVTAPVFGRRADGRVSVRLPLNGLVCWAPEAEQHVPALRDALIRNTVAVKLQAGQGLLVDNHRWATGRGLSVGPHRLLRALGFPHDDLPVGALPAHSARGGAA